VGQIISVPLQAAGSANGAGDFRVYDPSEIIGETSPHMPAPPPKKNGCGFLGKLIMIVVAIIVTVYAPEFLPEVLKSNAIVLGAASAAAGSIASQIVGNAIGAQDGFSWKSVALAAIGGGVSAGLPATIPGFEAGSFTNTVARAMIGNAISQGIGVVTGLQDKFSWGSVAAAGLGAGVGHTVSEALGITDPQTGQKTQAFKQLSTGEQFTRSLAVGLAAGAATAIARGGKISAAQVAVDAFGNALGGYFTGEFDSESDPTSKNYRNSMDRESDAYRPQFAYGYRNGMDMESDNAYARRRAQEAATQPSFAQDVAARKAAGNPMGLPTQAQPPAASVSFNPDDVNGMDLPNGYPLQGTGTARDQARGGRILAQMRDADPTSQAAIERAQMARALAASDAAARANNPNYDSRNYPAFVSSGSAVSAAPSSAMYNTGADLITDPQFGGYAGSDASQTYAARSIRAGVGIVETVAAGGYNSGVRIAGGAASVPYAIFGGVDAGVAVQEGIKDRFGYTPRSAGAQDVAQVLAPVGEFVSSASNRVRAFSESHIGDGATTIIGGVLQAGVEIAGVTAGLSGVGRALGSADYIFVQSATPTMMSQRGIVSGGQWIQTVTPEMRATFAGNGVLDPTTNTFRSLASGERMAVDHIVPSAEIVRMDGFNRLTKQQMTDILQDNIGLGNLQPLPQGINASKGARLAEDWTHVGKQPIDVQYQQSLGNLQKDLTFRIQNQIKDYNRFNQLNRR
jgi:hypothetical protein